MSSDPDANRTTVLQDDGPASGSDRVSGEQLTWTDLTRWVAAGPQVEVANAAPIDAALAHQPSGHAATGAAPTARAKVRAAAADDTLPAGSQLGRFSIVSLLGRGGTGSVYEAVDTQTEGSVAIKVLRGVLASQLVSFKMEFRVAASVAHANLVTPLELSTDGAHWYIVLELLRGADFITALRPAPGQTRGSSSLARFDDGRMRAQFLQLLDGLEALHAASIVHRDLKPSNVIVTRDGRVRIVDFGLAVLRVPGHAWVDASGRVVGSPAYMAPEQVASEPIVAATDLYGVGVMLFETLTGSLPYAGGSYAMMMSKLTVPAPDPRAFDASIAPELAELTRRLLARDPAARPTLEEVRQRLSQSGRPDSRPPRAHAHPLIGRELESAALRNALARARSGAPVVVSVEGGSGVGKSALMAEFTDSLHERTDTLVLCGRCHQLESIPHKGFDGAVDMLRVFLHTLPPAERAALLPPDFDALTLMFPVLKDLLGDTTQKAVVTDELTQRQRAHTALKALLRGLANRLCIVIALDDLQWGDLDGARLFEELTAPDDPLPLMFVLGFRSEEADAGAFLRQLAEDPVRSAFATREQIQLGSLSFDQAKQLAEQLCDGDTARAARIARASGGEPFLVEQLAMDGSGEWSGCELRTVIMSRANRLGLGAMQLLELVSIAAQPIPERLLGLCVEFADPHPLCAQLVALSLLCRSHGEHDTLVFAYHDRQREAVAFALDEHTRERLHFLLASHGEREGLLPAHALADHFARAGLPERARHHAFEAGRSAERTLAFELAADMFARANELAGDDAELATRARAEHARCLHLAGRCAEAGAAFLRVREDCTGSERVLMSSRAVDAWLACGRVDRAFELLSPLLTEAGSSYPEGALAIVTGLLSGVARARLALVHRPTVRSQVDQSAALRADLLWAAGKGLLAVVPAQGAVLALRSVFPALASGDPHRIGRSLAFLGSGFVPFLGRAGERAMRWARELAESYGDDHLRLMLGIAHAARGLLGGDWALCVESARGVLGAAPQTAVATAWEQSMAHTLLVSGYEYQGELREMERACLACLRDVRARGDQITAVTVVSAHGYCYAARHDAAGLDDLIADMTRAMSEWKVGAGMWDFYALRLRVLRALCWGDCEGAHTLLDASWSTLERQGLLRMPIVRGPALIIRLSVTMACAMRRAEDGRLERLVRRQLAELQREPRRDCRVHADIVEAALADRHGEPAKRDGLLERAERESAAADLRAVRRTIGRVRATLAGELGERARLDDELAVLGVIDAGAWALFLAPGWSHHA